jgi:hypothetical protein
VITISSTVSPGWSIEPVRNVPEKRLSISRWVNAKREADSTVTMTKNLEI